MTDGGRCAIRATFSPAQHLMMLEFCRGFSPQFPFPSSQQQSCASCSIHQSIISRVTCFRHPGHPISPCWLASCNDSLFLSLPLLRGKHAHQSSCPQPRLPACRGRQCAAPTRPAAPRRLRPRPHWRRWTAAPAVLGGNTSSAWAQGSCRVGAAGRPGPAGCRTCRRWPPAQGSPAASSPPASHQDTSLSC